MGNEARNKIIIGIIGKIGSGKDTVCDYIAQEYNFQKINISDYVRALAKKEGQSLQRDQLHKISQHYMEKYGKDYFCELTSEEIISNKQEKFVLSGIRTPDNIKYFRKMFPNQFYLLGVAMEDDQQRYVRVSSRKSERDHISFEEFLKQNKNEEAIFQTSAAINQADAVVQNDEGLLELFREVDAVIANDILKE